MAGGYNESNIASSYVALLNQADAYNRLREHVAERALALAGVGSLEGITVADAGCGDGRW